MDLSIVSYIFSFRNFRTFQYFCSTCSTIEQDRDKKLGWFTNWNIAERFWRKYFLYFYLFFSQNRQFFTKSILFSIINNQSRNIRLIKIKLSNQYFPTSLSREEENESKKNKKKKKKRMKNPLIFQANTFFMQQLEEFWIIKK